MSIQKDEGSVSMAQPMKQTLDAQAQVLFLEPAWRWKERADSSFLWSPHMSKYTHLHILHAHSNNINLETGEEIEAWLFWWNSGQIKILKDNNVGKNTSCNLKVIEYFVYTCGDFIKWQTSF